MHLRASALTTSHPGKGTITLNSLTHSGGEDKPAAVLEKERGRRSRAGTGRCVAPQANVESAAQLCHHTGLRSQPLPDEGQDVAPTGCIICPKGSFWQTPYLLFCVHARVLSAHL